MPIYQVSHYSLDELSVRALRNILSSKKYVIDDFIMQVETYIEDYFSIVKSSLEIPKATATANQLEETANNIDQVLNNLQTLPTFGVPLLKAKASFSGLGYLPEILNRTQTDLMHMRDLICWVTDNIRGEVNNDELYRLRTLISNIASLYKAKFDKTPVTHEKSEFMRAMQIIFLDIEEPFSELIIKKEVDTILEEDLSMKY